MSSIVLGALSGIQEFCLAPVGLWRMHRQILASSRQETTLKVAVTPLHDQARRRMQLQAASGSRRTEFTSKYNPRISIDSSVTSYSGIGASPSLENLQLPAKSESSTSNTVSGLPESRGILRLLSYIWLYNMLLVLLMGLVFRLLSIILDGSYGRWLSSLWIINIPCHLVLLVLQNFIFLVMELVNFIYLKKICERISLIQEKQAAARCRSLTNRTAGGTSSSSSRESSPASVSCIFGIRGDRRPPGRPPQYGIGQSLIDCVYSIIFFIIYRLQWKFIAAFVPVFWINFAINTISQAFTYACYAYEYYARQTSDMTINDLLLKIVNHWPFFVGYGLTLGAVVSGLPGMFGWGDLTIAFTYPILVVGSFQVPWNYVMNTKFRAPECTKRLLILSMRPGLYATGWLLHLFEWLGSRFWRKHPVPATRPLRVGATAHVVTSNRSSRSSQNLLLSSALNRKIRTVSRQQNRPLE